MFKTKEKKQKEAELKAQRLEKEKIEKEEKKIADRRAREKAFLQELNDDLKNDVVCYTIDDTSKKQVIINFFLKNNYICVQNAFSSDEYHDNHALTFVKEHLKDRFSSK